MYKKVFGFVFCAFLLNVSCGTKYKKIEHINMQILDSLFNQEPSLILRISKMQKEIKNVRKEIDRLKKTDVLTLNGENKVVSDGGADKKETLRLFIADDQKKVLANISEDKMDDFIKKNKSDMIENTKKVILIFLEKVLSPVEFLLHENKKHKIVIEPIMKEVLPESQFKEKMLCNFFDSDKDIMDFCKDVVNSINDFENICLELEELLGTVKENLSDETKKNYVSYIKTLKKEKKN
jgi:hypothetical protein